MSQIFRDIIEIARCGVQYRADLLAPMGLKSCHASYLMAICACPGISQDGLARKIYINKSNVARQVAALEESGLLERRACGKDKRVLRLYPTEKALALMPQVDSILDSWDQRLLQDLSEQEQTLLEELLQRIRKRAAEAVAED